MNVSMSRHRLLRVVCPAIAAALVLAACSNSPSAAPGSTAGQATTTAAAGSTAGAASSGAAGSSAAGGETDALADRLAAVQPDPALQAMLPDKLKNGGTAVVAVQPTVPPFDFYGADNKTIIGLDPDLMAGMQKVLGFKIQYTELTFSGIVAGVASGRFDLSMTSMYDTISRHTQIDFVDYFSSSDAIMTAHGNPNNFKTIGDVCGHTMVVQQGTSGVQTAQDAAAKCPSSAPMKINLVDTQPDAVLQIQSGRADAGVCNGPTAQYIIGQRGLQVQVLDTTSFNQGVYGIGVPKSTPGLSKALKGAIDQLIAKGYYKAVLDKWHISESSALPEATINGGTRK